MIMQGRLWQIGWSLLAISLVATGCDTSSMAIREPRLEIVVLQPSPGEVRFQFYVDTGCGLSAPQCGRKPWGPRFLSVLEAGMVIWRIEDPRAIGADEITYGKLPVGFIQHVPTEGEAPPLTLGQTYTVYGARSVVMGKASFVYSQP